MVAVALVALVLAVLPPQSPLRSPDGQITAFSAPLMQSIVPLIFILFFVPGTVYGYVAGTVKSHRDLIKGMSKSMETMSYYLVMIFFCAQFTAAFGRSNLGALLAVLGADFLQFLDLPGGVDDRRHHRSRDRGELGRWVGLRQVGLARGPSSYPS